MKTVLILAGLVALTVSVAVPFHYDWKLKSVDADFVERQRKVLYLFEHLDEEDYSSEWYKAGKEWNIESHLDLYTNKKAVDEFLSLYRTGFMPKYHEFSIFYERMRDEAISLFHIMYYAKDFETFFKTASWAKLYFNQGQFLYAYYIAVLQRPDTNGIIVPAPYELYPQYFFNKDVLGKMFNKYLYKNEWAPEYGVVKEHDYYVYYSNYSSSLTYPNEEARLSYFTEDIGFNAYYYYFHTHLPFWWSSEKFGEFKERRGELYYYFYQQLMARYNLERLSNGLSGIPEFSWYLPFKTGYYPYLTTGFMPFAQRSNYFDVHSEKNLEAVRFLDSYEKTFFQYLQQGHFQAFNKEVDFHSPKAINFVGNYWQTNADLYGEEHIEDYQHSYEITARHVLGGSPAPLDKYSFMPSALDFYQTSLRDPAFYQLYQRIVDYFNHFKQYQTPYTYDDLHFVGVKINDVKVDKMVTYFEHFDYNMTNSLVVGKDEYKYFPQSFVIRQPRLNNKPFTITVDVKSDVATDAVFKIFLGPKYDTNGYPISIERDWSKFYELDWFLHKLVAGDNKVVRKSFENIYFKEDSMPVSKIYEYLQQGKIPYDMSVVPYNMPRRLMLPRGTQGGYPFQLFVFVYPYNGVAKEQSDFRNFMIDNKPFGYPFDRPVQESFFKQPNMYFEDVHIYHKGDIFPYYLNTPKYFSQKRQ